MISQSEFAVIKREYRRDRDVTLLIPLLKTIVGRVAAEGRMPPWLSPTGNWDAEARADALQGWLEKRLLRRRDILAAFDHAAAPGPFIASLEKSFRHYLMNAAPASELENLLDRTTAMLRNEKDSFSAWTVGHEYWGLAEWVDRAPAPEPWRGSDRDLLSHAWSLGYFEIVRYGPDVGRASPILSTKDLRRFLVLLFQSCKALLDKGALRTVLRERFGIGDESAAPLSDDDKIAGPTTVDEHLREQDARAIARLVLEEMTPRQVEVIIRRHKQETLDDIAAGLGIARGTVDNEIKRVGCLVERLKQDFSEAEIMEIVAFALSYEA
jgi:DNA-binding CsgD family transcriptional regulator